MTVCLDTNVFLQIFGRKQPYHAILEGLLRGRFTIAVSTEILIEYEEVTTKLSGPQRWQDVATFLQIVSALHGNILQVDPQYRFGVIAADPDDNKFADCAITAEADYVVTQDAHFSALESSGYRPRPITPEEFITRHLAG